MVMMYGSAFRTSGLIFDPCAWSAEGRPPESPPKRYAPIRQSSGRQKAKITSAIAIQPAPPTSESPSVQPGVIQRL